MARPKVIRWTIAAAVLVAVVLTAASIQRLPDGKVALRGTRIETGRVSWHLPFAPLPLVDDPGSISLPSVPWRSKEGSTLEFSLELAYTLAPAIAPQLASDAVRSGWTAAIGTMAEHVLAEVGQRSD